ncbi:hypothetical protein ACH5RR_007305 [Cinchona calisaya]|uniref:NB-ARC domain-containing protein n=1 Tax=Cinchona calisaya TaxID=153742 RepID=A0ABD3ARK6_9GENT
MDIEPLLIRRSSSSNMEPFSYPSRNNDEKRKMQMDLIVHTFVVRLSSLHVFNIKVKLNLENEIDKLQSYVKSMKHEGVSESEDVLQMLKDALYDGDNILDECQIYSLRSQLSATTTAGKHKNPLLKVGEFFSRINRVAFWFRMKYKLNMLIKRINKISPYSSAMFPPFDIDVNPLKNTYAQCGSGVVLFDHAYTDSEVLFDHAYTDSEVLFDHAYTDSEVVSCAALPQFGTYVNSYWDREITYSCTFVRDGEVVGREVDKDRVVKGLINEPESGERISCLPIVGVGGIGKTTLARMVYNDDRIIKHFQLRMWVGLSREFNLNNIIERIIESASTRNGNYLTAGGSNEEMAELQNVLRGILHEKKYLLILDNVWSEDVRKWNELRCLLDVGASGSKIVVTTRIEEVAAMMGTIPVHYVKGLSNEDCLSLFLSKAVWQGESGVYADLLSIASEIVQKCEGVPLIALILGGSLHLKTDEHTWERVRDHTLWNSSQQNDIILPAFRVSYEQLPSHLKVCLAYCSMFLKDNGIEIDKLIQLWMAEGLIHSSAEGQEPEVIGIKYFDELWKRSFFLDIEENRPLINSVCRMHDLVHDLALSVAETDIFVISSHTQTISSEVRHVAFADYNQLGKEFPKSLIDHHMLRTIYFQADGLGLTSSSFVETCISRFSHLWVLDLSGSSFEVLPSSIGELKHLRYFDLSGNSNIIFLPDSLCSLQSLQTLRLAHCTNLNGLPKDIGKLISLRQLHVTIKQQSFPVEIGHLSSLNSLSISCCQNLVSLSEGLQYLTDLRTLAIVGCPKLSFLPSRMKSLTALENLLIIDCEEMSLFEWQDIEGLKILRSLVIGGLDELEAKDIQSLESLRSLVIAGLPQLVELPHWLRGASNTLQYLQIARCQSLMAMPKFLEDFTTLEKIEIIECLKLSSLPDGIFSLAELKMLKIDDCPGLKIFESKSRASNIQVKEIYVDGILIQ